MSSHDFSRRSLLSLGAAGAASLALPRWASARGSAKKARNIIFCVSDGMSMGVPTMVDHLSQIRDGKPSYWAWLMNQPFAVNGLQDTRSLNSLVTDSSAASSSWGSGRHIWNGMVNMYPDGTKLRTLTQIMTDVKVRCGLVTTATITHATPAGFCVNAPSRDDEEFIAAEYLKSGVDVLMGGGDKFFSPTARKDKRDLYGDFEKAGYEVVKNRKQLLGLQSNRVLGIFSSSHVPYTVDRNNDAALQESTPTLAEMAKVAIDNLKDSKSGFLLQIEGARIDHAAHSNDLAAMLYDQMAFEEAVKVAIDFALADGETLVVITSDHGNGNPGLNGYGDEYIDSTAGLKSVLDMKGSYGTLLKELGLRADAAKAQEVVKNRLGIELSAADAEVVAGVTSGKTPFGSSIFYKNASATLAVILGNSTKVTWTSTNHTSDRVLLTAVGPGAEQFAGLTQNISIFDTLLAHKDLKVNNPTMSFAEAQPLYEKMRKGGEEAEAHMDAFV